MTTKNENADTRTGETLPDPPGRATASTSEKAATFTPGPWRVVDESERVYIRPVANGYMLASLARDSFTYGNNANEGPANSIDANARLIAAAPDLYAACKALLEYHLWALHGDWRDQPVEPTTIARAALVKATRDPA